MKISRIRIKNFMGVTDVEFTPKGFTEITGPNGSNKTSIITAIKSVVEGGHDATLLRVGAEKGEVGLVLDDGLKIDMTIKSHDTIRKVTPQGTKQPVRRPMETISALTDVFSVNPIQFMTAPKADRARVLLESMPIEVDTARLEQISGFKAPAFRDGTHALDIINGMRTLVYDARTGDNRELEAKRATIGQLKQAIPDAPGGVTQDEDDLAAEVTANNMKMVADLQTVQSKFDEWTAGKNAAQAAATETFNAALAELNRQIAELREAHRLELAALAERAAAVSEKAGAARARIKAETAAANQPLEAQLAIVRANREAAAKRTVTLETIATMMKEAESLEAMSLARTESLEAIDAYKAELLANLPIPNLEVRNGEIYRNGVVYDRLNNAQRTEIAIELAELRAGNLGICCVDGLELLDQEAYEAFKARAARSGLQFFVTRVSHEQDAQFHINTTDAA